jgi:hypothetical protein
MAQISQEADEITNKMTKMKNKSELLLDMAKTAEEKLASRSLGGALNKLGLLRKGMGIISVYPMISQAIRAAADPDPINAMAAAAVGIELAPAGSEERDIQLGRLL